MIRTITVPATIPNLEAVMAFTERFLEEVNCPLSIQMKITIAVEELVANVAHYAYPEATGELLVIAHSEGDDVRFTFIDAGIPFNPVEAIDPDISLKAEERQIGGLGIYMVKKMVDKLTYKRYLHRNIVSIRKNIRKEN